MLKLVKYEYRRNITGILVVLAAILGLQGYFLGAAYWGTIDHVMAAGSLLMMAAGVTVAVVLLYSVSLYSKELNAKTSYLTFMTPNSTSKILGSKLLATLLLGALYALLLGAFAVWDFDILRRLFPQIEFIQVMLDSVLTQMHTNLSSILITASSLAFDFLVNFFTTVVVAYLAITLSATVLQNKKFKGILSFLLFILIMVALGWLLNLLPTRYDYLTMQEMLLDSLPATLISLAFAVAAFLLSAYLLKKKVSL